MYIILKLPINGIKYCLGLHIIYFPIVNSVVQFWKVCTVLGALEGSTARLQQARQALPRADIFFRFKEGNHVPHVQVKVVHAVVHINSE